MTTLQASLRAARTKAASSGGGAGALTIFSGGGGVAEAELHELGQLLLQYSPGDDKLAHDLYVPVQRRGDQRGVLELGGLVGVGVVVGAGVDVVSGTISILYTQLRHPP